MQLPRMTTRRRMVSVAIVAVSTAGLTGLLGSEGPALGRHVGVTNRSGRADFLGVRAGDNTTEAVLNLDPAKELRRMLDEAIAHGSGANCHGYESV